MQLKKSRTKIYFFLLLALLLIIVFVYQVFQYEQTSKKQNLQLQQSLLKLSNLSNVYIDVKNIESGQRGYLISGDTSFLTNYYRGLNDLKNDREFCLNLFDANEIQQTKYDSLILLIDQKITFSKDAVEIKKQFGIDSAQHFIASGKGIYLMSLIDNKMIEAQNYFLSTFNTQTFRNEQHFFRRRNNLIVISLLFSVIFILFYFLLKKYFSLQLKKEKDLKYNQSLVSNIYDAIISTDLEFNITKWNFYAERIFLYKDSEVIGKNLFTILNIVDENNQLENIIRDFHKNKKWVGDLINHDKNGRKIFVHVSASVLKDENQQTIGTVSVIRDISENRSLHSSLQQYSNLLEKDLQIKLQELTYINERLSLISKATNDAIWDWETGTDRIWGNELYLNMLDKKEGNFVSYNYFISKIHEDDRIQLRQGFEKIINQKKPTSSMAEFRFTMPNGEQRYFLNKSLYLFNTIGDVTRVVGALQDITIQKEVQQKIISEKEVSDSIINSLPGIFYMFNKNGKFIRWNKNTLIITGYTNEELEALHPFDFFTDDQKAFVSEKINRVFTQGSEVVEAELLTKTKQRISYYFTGNYIRYNNEDCVVGVGIDISDKINTQKQLRELALHIQNVREEERKSISREIHDELGQQLTGLKMDISWLSKKINNSDDLISSKIDSINQTVKNTIKSLQDISIQLRPSILDDLGLVAAMEWQCEEFEKRYNISSNFDSDLNNLDIPSDIATTIFRVYQESLTNILKHSKANMTEASLTLESGLLVLIVSDNGIGFDVNNILHKKSFGLLGIKERTLLLNGSFDIKAESGLGTILTIKIPIPQNQTS